MEHLATTCKTLLSDIEAFSSFINAVELRTYQAEAGSALLHAALAEKGGSFSVMFPRQSGKNELQAQLESLLLAANAQKGGDIVKISPTYTNQTETSRFRLTKTLEKSLLCLDWSFERGRCVRLENARLNLLSGNKRASIVGATASILLETDEAQDVSIMKYDKEAAPMAAATNAPRIFWGTAWDDMTLLAREQRQGLSAEREGKGKQAFVVNADIVGKEVRSYAEFVKSQIEALGRDHPMVRTQFYCEEITDEAGMFNSQRLSLMRGEHAPQAEPESMGNYIFLVDVGGSDELSSEQKRDRGFSDYRDATVITICQIVEPEDVEEASLGVIWKVAARRFYRNVPSKLLKKFLDQEIKFWDPQAVVIDSTGLGCDLADWLNNEHFNISHAYHISAKSKSEMAFSFLSIINSGRWKEYKVEGMPDYDTRPFKKGVDDYEIIDDPGELQRMFFRQLRYCRMEPVGDDGKFVKWCVPDGARDPETGELIHDDLVMSAAMCTFEDRQAQRDEIRPDPVYIPIRF